jgi:pimeloyl-ACP methyl ester carboxylesterase
VTELGIGKLSLIGNSMGGGLAWLYASSYPQQVQSLVLVDAAGWPLPPTDQLPIAFRILQYRLGRWFLSQIDNTPLIEQGLRQNVHDAALITPVLVSRWAALQRAPGHRRILMSASPTSFAAATVERLKAIQSPTLVMHGEKDSLIPIEHGRLFASHIENAILISYPDVGHLPQIEIPQRSAHDALRFLQETEANT